MNQIMKIHLKFHPENMASDNISYDPEIYDENENEISNS